MARLDTPDIDDPMLVPGALLEAGSAFREEANQVEDQYPVLASEYRCVADLLDECANHITTQLSMQRLLRRHNKDNLMASLVIDMAEGAAARRLIREATR